MPSCAALFHTILPVSRSSAYTRQVYITSSRVDRLMASTFEPASAPCRNITESSFAGMAVVTNTRLPQMTGLEWARPGIGVFHAMLVPFARSQVIGGCASVATPDELTPRNPGQLPPLAVGSTTDADAAGVFAGSGAFVAVTVGADSAGASPIRV